jgi:uncharacterized protein (TIGR02444 family)
MSEQQGIGGSSGAPSPFWLFSLRIYGQAGVPSACVTLQDSAGLDVNVLLFGMFAASRGRQLATADVAAIVAAIEPWKLNAVVPLRGLRRFLKEAPAGFEAQDIPALRQRVKMMELEAERLQQEVLHSSWPVDKLGVAAPADEAARANIQAYGAILGASLDTDAVDLLLAAFAKDLSSPAESKTL